MLRPVRYPPSKPIKMNSQQLYDEILHPVNCQYGAPMGRPNKGQIDPTKRVFDREVKFYDLAYDKGGAYWGCDEPLRVAFQEGYTEFYRGPKRLYKRVNGCLVRMLKRDGLWVVENGYTGEREGFTSYPHAEQYFHSL